MIKKLNKEYFGKNEPTDVISFNLKDKVYPHFLGEIIISVEEAVENSKYFGNSWEEEIIVYLIHGILHILGYEDDNPQSRKKMQKRENEIINYLKENNIL